MTWRAEITLRVRIGRERATPPENDSASSEPPHTSDLSGATIERADAPAPSTVPPIGFHPAPEDARRSGTSTRTPPHAR